MKEGDWRVGLLCDGLPAETVVGPYRESIRDDGLVRGGTEPRMLTKDVSLKGELLRTPDERSTDGEGLERFISDSGLEGTPLARELRLRGLIPSNMIAGAPFHLLWRNHPYAVVIHTSSATEWVGPAHLGETLYTRGVIEDAFEKRGRFYVTQRVVTVDGAGNNIARMLHAGTYEPAPKSTRPPLTNQLRAPCIRARQSNELRRCTMILVEAVGYPTITRIVPMNLPFGRGRLSQRQRLLIWTAIALYLLALFVFDALTPRGFESDDLYLPLILAVALWGRPRDVLIVAVAASVLDVAAFFPSPAGIATGYAIGNRALGILTIWLTASLVLATRNLWTANTNLQREIAQRQRAEEELRKALAAKDDFLGMVSHEMRTPLTAVMGIASLLDTPAVTVTDEERAELVTEMRVSSERLAATIENMLALARVEAGRKLEFAPVSLSTIIDEQVAQHLKNHPGRRIGTRQAGQTPNAMGSADYVRHVVANLLENATKYSPEEQPVEVDLRREGDEVVVRVLDRGIGLTEDEAEHVFEAFYRSPRIASGSSGMGIGLSVCRRLVEEQGGRIWALHRPGGGSEFGFSLPGGRIWALPRPGGGSEFGFSLPKAP